MAVTVLCDDRVKAMMRGRWIDEKMETISNKVDNAAARLHPRRDSIKTVPDRDQRLTGIFPYFIGICLAIWICGYVYIGDFTFSKLIETLCLVFVVCFAILGVPCLLVMDRGVFSNWVILALVVAMTGLMWVSGIFLGKIYYTETIQDIMSSQWVLDNYWQFILEFGGTLCIMFFTSIGVLSIISAYMRLYIAKVFLLMQRRAGTGRRGKAEFFFMVPDIIDIKEVVLEPEKDPHMFHFSTASSVSAYLFMLGLLVSSYLFMNPLLISELGWKTMLTVTLMLSMFLPALVLPWQIVRSVGAKVRSNAPRDYYLWTGARKRLFSTFATLGVFMMMFVLSVYLGNSITGIAMSYISFLVPLFATSVMYGAFYANNFDTSVVETICQKFDEGKEAGKIPEVH